MSAGTLFDSDDPDGEELLPGDGSAKLHRSALSPATATRAFEVLLSETPWQQHTVRVYGRQVNQPRLVAWFGDPGRAYTYSGLTLDSLPWTPGVTELRRTCESMAGHTFNSGLANLYRNGDDSVSWHADDEPELGPQPVIASLSLGAERRFHFRHKMTGETVKTVLPSGSLVIMSDRCQQSWLHQVPKMRRVQGARINLTFRNVVAR